MSLGEVLAARRGERGLTLQQAAAAKHGARQVGNRLELKPAANVPLGRFKLDDCGTAG